LYQGTVLSSSPIFAASFARKTAPLSGQSFVGDLQPEGILAWSIEGIAKNAISKEGITWLVGLMLHQDSGFAYVDDGDHSRR
jgi:hypothetical protein